MSATRETNCTSTQTTQWTTWHTGTTSTRWCPTAVFSTCRLKLRFTGIFSPAALPKEARWQTSVWRGNRQVRAGESRWEKVRAGAWWHADRRGVRWDDCLLPRDWDISSCSPCVMLSSNTITFVKSDFFFCSRGVCISRKVFEKVSNQDFTTCMFKHFSFFISLSLHPTDTWHATSAKSASR